MVERLRGEFEGETSEETGVQLTILSDEVAACHDALDAAGVSNVGELLRDRIARAVGLPVLRAHYDAIVRQRDEAREEVEKLKADLDSARLAIGKPPLLPDGAPKELWFDRTLNGDWTTLVFSSSSNPSAVCYVPKGRTGR